MGLLGVDIILDDSTVRLTSGVQKADADVPS